MEFSGLTNKPCSGGREKGNQFEVAIWTNRKKGNGEKPGKDKEIEKRVTG